MFHNIAPTGLPSLPASKDKYEQQNKIESAILSSINEIVQTKNSSLDQKLILNMSNSDILLLVKSLDRFFAHGLIKIDKCYWSFVRELIPSEERIDLKQKWNCSNRRELSLAWLKDSLNRRTLQFQMFGFIACNDLLKRLHYERNSCLRNLILLKRVCLYLDDIAEFEFCIEPPYVFRIEDTPIALPLISSPIDGTMSPVQSTISNSPIASIAFGGINSNNNNSIAMNIHRKRRESAAIMSTNGSFCEISRNSYLEGLVDDLPEVDITKLTAGETSVQSAKEQSYILDQMLRNKRKGFASYNSNPNFIFDDDEEEKVEETEECSNSLIPDDPCTSNNWIEMKEENKEEEELKNKKQINSNIPNIYLDGFNKKRDSKLIEIAFLNSLALQENKRNGIDDSNSTTTREDDELSQLGENETLLEGEIFLDSGEIIQLQLELCIKDGERIHRLFQVFTGHATGQSSFKYLLITDQFVYLLAPKDENKDGKDKSSGFENIKNVVTGTNPELGISPASVVIEELAAEAFERNSNRLVNGEPPIALPLTDLEHLTTSIDAQVLCFHSKSSKFIISQNSSGHQLKTFLVETCSKILGKTIVFALRRTMANKIALAAAMDAIYSNSESSSSNSEKQKDKITPLTITSSHSSHLAVVIKRFLASELGPREHDIFYMSLIYWQQNLHQHQKSLGSTSSLECYMYIREIYQRSWNRKTIAQWQQSYLLLRDTMEEVCRIDLTNDEKYAFQITFSTDVAGDGLCALQIGCPNEEIMKRWISAISMALYVSGDNPPPVACMAILTSTHLVFAQEGVNCAVDGFMRGLCSISREECSKAEIYAIHTEFNTGLMIRRNDGSSEDEWLLFRERFELDRIVNCLRERWELKVIFCGDIEVEKIEEIENLEFNENSNKKDFVKKLVLECSQMTNLWRVMPIDSVDDSRHF
uniref:RUN domain-containing protein n=1 Tax=Meloidogyne hapla TaxID=6305 RepID=A0A1I8BJ45_MELHA